MFSVCGLRSIGKCKCICIRAIASHLSHRYLVSLWVLAYAFRSWRLSISNKTNKNIHCSVSDRRVQIFTFFAHLDAKHTIQNSFMHMNFSKLELQTWIFITHIFIIHIIYHVLRSPQKLRLIGSGIKFWYNSKIFFRISVVAENINS